MTAVNLLNLLFKSEKPVDEKVAIIQNKFHIAMGDKFREVMNNMGSFAQTLRSEAASEAAYDKALSIAKWMIANNPCSARKMAEGTNLDEQTILELAISMGVTLPQD